MSCADLRILFRAAAGPRRGFGHLVRCRSLARALGVRPLVALRGGRQVEETALALGCDVVRGTAARLLRALAPDILVVDDPVTADARRWIAAGRRAGCLVVSVHDLGLGCLDADLVIDGSVTRNASGRRGTTLAGPRFAVLDPSVYAQYRTRDPYSVLVALGGGPRAELALDIADAIVAAEPRARVRIAGGFLSKRTPGRREIAWVAPTPHLHHEMARAAVAVVGGGVSLYEACALGTPAIGVAVVPSQRPTIAAFVARGAAKGFARARVSPRSVADECAALLTDAAMQRQLSRAGRRLIDGRGAFRAAAAVRRLANQPWSAL